MSAPLPQLWGVLYSNPNTDGSRKLCANCRFADDGATECEIVDAPITPDMVCGYHLERGQKAPPALAGLETVGDRGTSCGGCRFYQQMWDQPVAAGVCSAVESATGNPAYVAAMGCCARWERRA